MSSPLAWFQLVDLSTGLPYKGTSVSSIIRASLVLPIVDQFRDAVKAKYDQPNYLKDIPSGVLQVFKNKASFDKRNAEEGREGPLKASCVLTGLGETEEDALIVTVQATDASNPSFISVTSNLKQLGVQISVKEVNYLLNYETDKYSLLRAPNLTVAEAQRILTYVRSKLNSATKKAIGLQYSYFLDGTLHVSQGQTKSSLYYAFSEPGVVHVAKVYNNHREDFMREVDANNALDHENLVKFIETFSIQNDSRHIIIMPLFPRSVADWLIQQPQIPMAAFKVIARSCFAALCHVHEKGFCFADLKPSNIMLPNAEPARAVLVDYGAIVPIDSSLIEFTSHYCLDADTSKANVDLDWICLGTTLAQMAGFQVFSFKKAAKLARAVHQSAQDMQVKTLIASCLDDPYLPNIENALNQLE